MDSLETLRSLCHPGIFCLYNRKKNKGYISVCVNMGQKISELMKKLETNNFTNQELIDDRNDLELIVLETYRHVPARVGYKIGLREMQYWHNYVRKLGIELYDNKLHIVNYKARLNFAVDDKGKDLIIVEAITKRYNKQIVGVFKTIPEAEHFISLYYKNPINKLVTAYNKQTQAFLCR